MVILEDMGQKEEKHLIKNRWFYENGIEVIRAPLPVGDYIIADEKVMDVLERKGRRGMHPKKMDFLGTYNVSVDTKESIGEIINNICGKSHDRFRDECILAQNNGVQLHILVENEDGVTSIDGGYPILILHKNVQLYSIVLCQNTFIPKTIMRFSADIIYDLTNTLFCVHADIICTKKIHLFRMHPTPPFPFQYIHYLFICNNIISHRQRSPDHFNSIFIKPSIFNEMFFFLLSHIFQYDHFCSFHHIGAGFCLPLLLQTIICL